MAKKIWKYEKFVLNQVNHSCRGFFDLWLIFGGCYLFSEGDWRGLTGGLNFPCSPGTSRQTETSTQKRDPHGAIPKASSTLFLTSKPQNELGPMLWETSLGFPPTNQKNKNKPQVIYIAKSLLTSPKGTRGKFLPASFYASRHPLKVHFIYWIADIPGNVSIQIWVSCSNLHSKTKAFPPTCIQWTSHSWRMWPLQYPTVSLSNYHGRCGRNMNCCQCNSLKQSLK